MSDPSPAHAEGAREPPAPPETSVDDILASIRRILSEEDAPAAGAAPRHAPSSRLEPEDDVLDLDRTMMVEPPSRQPVTPHAAIEEAHTMSEPDPIHAADAAAVPQPGLVAPEAADAAASSVNDLVRLLSAERHTGVSRSGLTIEDLVREEIRPVLKQWLDAHLPPIVERLVRAEIERVVARAAF